MLLQFQSLVLIFPVFGYSSGSVDPANQLENAMKNAEIAIAAAQQAAASVQPANSMDSISAGDILGGSTGGVGIGSTDGTGLLLVDAASQVETAMKNAEAAIAAAEQAATPAAKSAADLSSGASNGDVLEGIMIGIKAGAALHAVHHAAVLQAAIEAQAAKAVKALKEEEDKRKTVVRKEMEEMMEAARAQATAEAEAKWAMFAGKIAVADLFNVNSIHEARWKAEDSMSIVPLHPKSRSGAMDMVLEEGIIAAAGPRFANEFYDDSDLEGRAEPEKRCVKCVLQCALTVSQAATCLAAAIVQNNPPLILRCISRDQLCNCRECLPPVISDWAGKSICVSSDPALLGNASSPVSPPYAEYMVVTPTRFIIKLYV